MRTDWPEVSEESRLFASIVSTKSKIILQWIIIYCTCDSTKKKTPIHIRLRTCTIIIIIRDVKNKRRAHFGPINSLLYILIASYLEQKPKRVYKLREIRVLLDVILLFDVV